MELNICLSGGGARGFAHLGAIKAFQEHGISIAAISGTSSGAIAGAFLAAGYSPDKILELFVKQKLFRMLSGAFNTGILGMERATKFYKKHLPDNFSSLNFPFWVAATDILKGETIYLNEGLLIPALNGSASIPGLFKPVRLGESLLLDGGVLNNLPVEPLLERNIPLAGIHVNPIGSVHEIRSTWKIIERTFQLSVYSNIARRKLRCNIFIEPSGLKQYSVFDYNRATEIFKTGYQFTKEIIPEILEKCQSIQGSSSLNP